MQGYLTAGDGDPVRIQNFNACGGLGRVFQGQFFIDDTIIDIDAMFNGDLVVEITFERDDDFDSDPVSCEGCIKLRGEDLVD